MITLDLPFKDYVKHPAYGSSTLRTIAQGRTVAHAEQRILDGLEPTESMRIGTCVHSLIEAAVSGRVANDIHVCTFDGRTKAGIAEREQNVGKLFLSPSEGHRASKMFESLRANDFIWQFIEASQTEVSFFWSQQIGTHIEPAPKMDFRARFDLWDEKNGVIGEIKTTSKLAGPRSFGRVIGSERYDVQAIHHVKAAQAHHLETTAFLFIVVESEAPYLTASYFLDRDVMARASDDWMAAATALAMASQVDDQVGWEPGPVTLTPHMIPIWS